MHSCEPHLQQCRILRADVSMLPLAPAAEVEDEDDATEVSARKTLLPGIVMVPPSLLVPPPDAKWGGVRCDLVVGPEGVG